MKKIAIGSFVLAFCLALTFVGGNYLAAFADDLEATEIEQESAIEETAEVDALAAPLSAEFSISGRPFGRSISLDWYAIAGADEYKISRATSLTGTYEELDTTENEYFFDPFLPEATSFYYVITAYGSGSEILASDPYHVMAELSMNTMGLVVSPDSSSSMSLEWDDSNGPHTYLIYRSDSEDGPFELIGETTDEFYQDEGLEPGHDYYYGVVPVFDDGQVDGPYVSGPEMGTTLDLLLPNPPEDLKAVILPDNDPDHIRLTWKAPSTGPAPDGYEVFLYDPDTDSLNKVADVTELFYDSPSIETDVEYTYYVRAYNSDGHGDYSNKATAILYKQLDAPATVTAKPLDPNTIQVDWSEVEGADRYYVYRSKEQYGNYELAGTVSDLTFTDPDLDANTDYYYVVKAHSDTKGEGLPSTPAHAKTPGVLSGAPQNVTADPLDRNNIEVKWDAVEGATSYKVYRSDDRDGPYTHLGDSSSTSYIHGGLIAGDGFYYKVSAVNTHGEGPQSDFAYAETALLPAPKPVNAIGYNTSTILVYWSPVDGADGYHVYRADSATGSYSLIGSTTNQLYRWDEGLPSDTEYYYVVTAYNKHGMGEQSIPVSARTHKAAPGKPLNVTAVGLDQSRIQVSWNAVAGATRYYVYRSDSADGNYSLVGNTTSTSLINSGLQADTGYFYKVAAENASGVGEMSDHAYGKTLAGKPGKPFGVTATALDQTRIQVSWTAVQGATRYYVYRSNTADGNYSLVGNTTSTSLINSGLQADTGYYYKVVAYNNYGYGEMSDYAYAKTLAGKPGAPMSVTAVGLDQSRIQVSWTAVQGATRYYIYRSNTATGAYTYVGQSTSTSFINTGLRANTGYYYKVSAYNNYGEGPQSDYAYGKTKGVLPAAPCSICACGLSEDSMRVTWSSVANADGYYIYRSDYYNGTYTYVGTSSTTSFIDTGLNANTCYYYKVVAYNETGTGPMSKYACGKTLKSRICKPCAPTCLRAVGLDESRMQVTWNATNYATGYYVYRSTSYNGYYTQVGSVTSTSFIDTGLNANTVYYYKIAAYNSAGTSPLSSYACGRTLGVSKPVCGPRLSGRVVNYQTTYLCWTKIQGATRYHLYRSTSPSGTYSLVASSAGTGFYDYSVSPNRTYYYKVQAESSSGARSEFSNTICLCTPYYYGCGGYYYYC